MVDKCLYLSVYRHSPVGLVIVDEEIGLVEVNDYLLNLFKINEDDYRGRKFGNVFHCASLPGGQTCGEAEPCPQCTIRGGISTVLDNDMVISDFTLNHCFYIDSLLSEKWFKISANLVASGGKKFAVVSFVDITKEKQYEQLLQHELTLDLATGVLNKQTLMETLQALVADTGSHSVFSAGIIDFDDFKIINDQFGHLIGDNVLMEFSNLARQAVRSQDIIGRFGGEEFAFIFPGTGIQEAASIMSRIFSDLNRRFQPAFNVTFSAGFVELSAGALKQKSGNEIFSIMDGYLYAAKKAGKRRLASENILVKFA